jgi:hypothetical protein
MEREAGQGERDIKKTRAEVEALRKKADGTGWNAEKERAHDCAAQGKGRCSTLCTGMFNAPSVL